MSEIIPAIIPESQAEIEKRVEEIKDKASILHIDVLPETFVPENFHVGMPVEAHFMFPGSHKGLEGWMNAGAKRVIVHLEDFESEEMLSQTILNIRSRSEVGLALKLETDIQKLYPLVSKIDFVQLMSIAVIGEQGHPFDERIFDKIKAVKFALPHMIVSVDGGVGVENAEKLAELCVERLVVGHNFNEVWSQIKK